MSGPPRSVRGHTAFAPFALLVLLVSCAGPVPDASPSGLPGGSPSSLPASPASTPSPSTADGLPFEPGRPYDAAAMLAVMRDSRRPGGVPDVIETDAVASAIAAAIWTIDGAAWDDVAAGGSCGPATCTVEVVGVRDDADGEDLWTFSVDPASGAVALLEALAGAVPAGMVSAIDARTRSLVPAELLDGMILASTRWAAPPADAAYELAYRTGNEEGACEIDLRLSADGRLVEDATYTDC